MKVELNYMPLVRVDCAELYQDKAFVEWLNTTDPPPASWHKRGGDPTEYSDIFMYCEGRLDGSDSNMPEHCWQLLGDILEKNGLQDTECVVWLSNLGMNEEDGDDIYEQDVRKFLERSSQPQ